MPDTRYLSRAPIVEALIRFQANAAENWRSSRVIDVVRAAWPEHTQIQELQHVELEFTAEAGRMAGQKIKVPEVDGFLLRAPDRQTAFQVRRDGLIVSWLAPYSDWTAFRTAAFESWAKFRQILSPGELHAVSVRYVNKLEFPLENFQLADFLVVSPAKPPEIANWSVLGFQHFTLLEVPDTGFVVQVISTQIDGRPGFASFILDIEVRAKESLAATGRTAEDSLEEMRKLKDQAFFSMLTTKAIDSYL